MVYVGKETKKEGLCCGEKPAIIRLFMKQISVRQIFLINSCYKIEGRKAEMKIWQLHRHRRVEDCFLPTLEAPSVPFVGVPPSLK